jgi:predicted Holliday junction resolvase-like endonuclease
MEFDATDIVIVELKTGRYSTVSSPGKALNGRIESWNT